MREHSAVYLRKPADMGFITVRRAGPTFFLFLFLFFFFFFVREMNSGGEKSGEESRRYVPWHDDRA